MFGAITVPQFCGNSRSTKELTQMVSEAHSRGPHFTARLTKEKRMPKTTRVKEREVVWEARQIAEDDGSGWVLVNTFNTNDVRVVSDEEYSARYYVTRAKVETVEQEPAQESDEPALIPQDNAELNTGLNQPVA
jgi:hypothetical protein